MPVAATDNRREGKLRRQGLCLARQLPELLRRSGTAGQSLLETSGACARDGRHPGVRLARVHRRAWDCRGLCSFHWKVAFGLIEH